MIEPLHAKCPECGSELFIDRVSGKVVEVRRPVADQQEGEDRFEALVRKAKTRGDAALKKFNEAQEKQKDKISRLDSLFKETRDRVQQSGDVGPGVRDIDMD